MMSRAFRFLLLAMGVLLALPWGARAAIAVSTATLAGDAAAVARTAREARLAEVLSTPFVVQIDDLPAAITAVSLERVRYKPGVELSEQPIDGPRLLLIESGVLSLEFARSGASRFSSGAYVGDATPLAAGAEHQVAVGDIVLIPAGVPLQLANRSSAPVTWLHVQAETPPTICACGEDLTGSETTLLASQTVERPLAAPATLTVTLDELEPGQSASAPDDGVVQLVASLDDAKSLTIGSDGQPRNDASDPVPVYILTLGDPATT